MAKIKIIVENLEEVDEWDSNTPSKITESYWVRASGKCPIKRAFNRYNIGKWLVFVDVKELDKTWQVIKEATQKGILGIESKAATAKPSPNATSENVKVICVYTYNWQDSDDVYRVEKALRKLGIKITLFYKTDSDTDENKYQVNCIRNISKYISKETKIYKKFDLASLYGVGDAKIEILRKVGILNFSDLLAFDTSKPIETVGISEQYINKIKLFALSRVENTIYRLKPFSMPTGEIIHFDIETDLYTSYETKRVWSIAIHHKNKVKRFYADTWEEEKKILTDFLDYIKALENPLLFSYSGIDFDKNVLKCAFIRHNLDSQHFFVCTHYDLCTILKQNYVFPVESYGLKEIGTYLGYQFKNAHFDGLYVAMRYIECQELGEKLPEDIFHYIEDDVKAMEHIIKRLQIMQNIKDIFDHNDE